MLLKKSKLLVNGIPTLPGTTTSPQRAMFKARLEEGMSPKAAMISTMGLMKGIVKTATKMTGGKGIIIVTTEDDYLELKVR